MVLENNAYPADARVRKEAESLAEAGHAVEVLAPRRAGEPRRETVDGVRVTRVWLPDGGGGLAGTAFEYAIACCVLSAAALARLARARGGVLHVHNPPDFFFPLMWLARARGWRSVFDHHDDAAGMLRDKLGRRTRAEALLAWMRARSARAADLTIVTNDTQRALVQRHAREVLAVPNCPPAWFAEHRSARPDGRARLVFLGEIGRQDRVERAVEVLAHVLAGAVDAELLIVGDGPQREAVRRRAAELGVSERLTITGWVPYERVPELLASAHVGLDTAPPTDVNNGSTMVKIREYLVVGLPVVASALRETLLTGADALVPVARDDAEAYAAPVLELLGSPERWHACAERARARGMELLWPVQAERLCAAYRSLHETRREPVAQARHATG